MRKYILMLIVSVGLMAQSPELKVKMPEWRPKIVLQHASGSPKEVIFYDNLVPMKRMRFFQNGNPLEETDLALYDDKIVPQGASVIFNEKGHLQARMQYENGLLEGECIECRENKEVLRTCHFKNGKMHGDAVGYFEGGSVQEKATYQEGVMHGDHEVYYDNGNKKYAETFVKGKKHGEAISWFENGSVKEKALYAFGPVFSTAS